MHDTKSVPALAAGYPPQPTRPDTEIGWAQGLLSDGRPWIASILEDEEGDRTLVMSYPALAHEEDNERVVVEHQRWTPPVGQGLGEVTVFPS